MKFLRILCGLVVSAAAANAALANITSTSLRIEGVGLKVITETVTTGIDLPVTIQTEFGGKQNDDAVAIEGLVAAGDLTGPGLETPIQLTTAPGHQFQIPGLSQAGTYYLQNIRLLNGTEFLQYATPAAAVITVADLLQTTITVKQLSPAELRARGITVDARNFNVYEYTFTFLINGQEVRINYPVIVDPRTHQVQPAGGEHPYVLPPAGLVQPPRWSPPAIIPMDFGSEGDIDFGTEPPDPKGKSGSPSIPAAIVIPNSLAVLHQFFGVLVMVQNGAPDGSAARLEDIRGTIRIPTALRTAGTIPQVSFGQPVPIVEPVTGVRFLVAQARGEAEWTLEGLQPGTHRIDFDIRATLKQDGQADMPLRATPSAAVVVHDPRFNINFSHPATVRQGIEYSTYAFITNMSATEQSITVTSGVEPCDVNPSANVCRLNGETTDLLTIPSGEMRLVEYRLRSGVTGQVFATAGTLSSENLSASVRLHMGVSESGIPLSPATLILPHYAQYVSADVVSANLQLFGLGYSLATAPLNAMTAKFPRVITTDVFQRAVDVARAGQRIFITNGAPAAKRDSISHLALDLLGNGGYELRQWDELRRQEKSGRRAGASVARELEATGLIGGATLSSFFDDFGTATAHRQGFVAALAHGTGTGERPYAIAIQGRNTGRRADIPNEAESGWVRTLPFSDISRFSGAGETGELALVGRWTEDLDVVVTPTQDGTFALDLLYPDTNDGSLKRAHFEIPGMRNREITITLTRGATALNAMGDAGVAAVGTVSTVSPAPLAIVGARQDMYLDEWGHKVSVLFNRPIGIPDGVDLRTKFTGAIDFDRDDIDYEGPRPISAAALQDDGRTVNLTFDHTLSQNATYTIATGALVDPVTAQSASFPGLTVPKLDNDLPGGVIYGFVRKGDHAPISGVDVVLRQYEPGVASSEPTGAPQYDISQSDGAFLFEWVRRQTELGWGGSYRLEAISTIHKTVSIEGSVRLPGKVHFVTLQYLGRGSAEGYVRYDNGEAVAGASVVVGSTMFNQFRTTTSDATGFYRVEDLPVGPLTFSARDAAGNVTYAASEIATAGQLVTQNLSIYRKPFPGLGRVHGTVRRSDTGDPVAGVHVGVYSEGYGLVDGHTDSSGRFSFDRIPAGFVTVLAEDWSFAHQSVASDFDLQPNEVKEANLLFLVPPAMQTTKLTGQVKRENPLQPGVMENVPGALVKIADYRLVTADAEGRFTFENLPLPLSGKTITAYDPQTKRAKDALVPTLTEEGPNTVAIFINAFDRGTGIIRVRLLNAAGSPVPGYRVIVPGFPPDVLSDVGNGVYELHGVAVGSAYGIRAVPVGVRPENGQPDPRPYGDQMASGSAAVAFNGHIAPLTLRLPGEGTVRVKVSSQIDLITPVFLSHPVWDESQQRVGSITLEQSTAKNGEADFAVFTRVPALSGGYTVSSGHPQYGSAQQKGTLAFDGDLQTHFLQLNTLSVVSGTVYAIDGITPIAGASVTIYNGRSDPGPRLTGPDGRFSFPDQPSNLIVTVTAQVTQSGIYRTGEASASTPVNGGVVENLSVVLRKRGFVEGQVIYKDYKRFDPNNVANNIPDDTPNDYSDNAPVPLAKFHLRELDFPRRTFGTGALPLTADVTGRFILSNVFVGALRATAWDSGNEELRGDWTGRIDEEGQEATPRAYIAIGDGGAGALTVRVVDPNQNYAEVANADVSLYRGGSLFDFTTTGPTGAAELSELPVGAYTVSAYSKSLGKSSSSVNVAITRDVTASLQLLLEFSGEVEGTLTDPEQGDAAVPGAHVRLTGANYSTQATTGVQGSFEFLGVREGAFRLDAKDTDTNRRASAELTLSILDPHRTVNLELEPTETLYFAAYLPDDFGQKSNVLAAPTRVDVQQRGGEYEREMQGNPLQFPGLFENSQYRIRVWQPGETNPEIQLYASFPKGSAADPFVYVFPAFGEVRVTVTQGGAPAAGARVTIHSAGANVTVYTDDTGLAIARGVRLGSVGIQAESLDRRFNGSAAATLQRQSVPATATIALGTYAGVTGYVEAEAGGPSIGTRVIANYSSHVGEVRTDVNGRYTFLGIPAPASGALRVHLTYIGPDDATTGDKDFVDVESGDGVVEANPAQIDATPPLIESILPADGAVDVSPDASITVTFSEELDPNTITTDNFQLVPADGSGPVTCALTTSSLSGDRFAVVMKPPTRAGGLPLLSNTLYRVIVLQNVQDRTGHLLPAPRAFAFTTSDYAEPRVLKVLPESPIPASTTFEFRFNEPIDPAPWQTGGNGVFHVYKLVAPGGASAAIERPVDAEAFVDPVTNMTLFIVPDDDDPIVKDSFYRVVFSGVRDPQGNALPGEQTYHFYSFDVIDPHVVFVAPSAGEQLVSGGEYEIRIEARDGSPTGTIADDVKKVEYFTVAANGTQTPFATVTQPPFAVKVLAPEAPASGATFTVGAQAFDTSGRQGPKTTATWTVKPNAAPRTVVVTPLAASAYPSAQIGGTVTFEDEGSFVTITMNFAMPRSNGTVETRNVTQSYSRLASGFWPEAKFVHTLPNDATPGVNATLTATVLDVRGLASEPGLATVAIAADLLQPTILSVTPTAGTQFVNRDTYAVEAIVSDAETGVQSVTFFVDGKSYAVASSGAGPTAGTQKFRSVQIEARAKAEDVNIPIVVTAKDWNGNTRSSTYDVVYKAIDDPNVPNVAWLCPIDSAAIPALYSNYTLDLRVSAVDEDVQSVKFLIGNDGTFVSATLDSGSVYRASYTFAQTPAAGALEVTAVVEDTVAAHTVELPIAIDVVAIDHVYTTPTAILAADAASLNGKSIAVIGSSAVFVPHVALTLENLLVLGGGRVETLPTDFDREFRLDITAAGTTYVDCASRIDVSEKGYLGGRARVGNFVSPDVQGRTVGNTHVGGADTSSSGSHAGVGGTAGDGYNTNAVYGSIFQPTDLGSGGGGQVGGGTEPIPGAPGGGAIRLRGGAGDDDASRIVLAGNVLALGGDGTTSGRVGAGSGGSIWIEGKQVLVGAGALVAANGGDDNGNAGTFGAGAGRIAIGATIKLDAQGLIEARGGRNTNFENSYSLDGGAGTIFLRRPGQPRGELIVSAYDSRHPGSIHPTAMTLLGRIGSGTSTAVAANALTDSARTFGRWMTGEELAIAGDTAHTFTVTGVSPDGHSLQTDPADGSLLGVATSQSVAYAGLLAFDKVTAGERALLVFDDHISVAGAVDTKSAMTIDPRAVVILPGEEPTLTLSSTPAIGASLVRNTNVSLTYTIEAAAGVRRVDVIWSLDSEQRIQTFPYPLSLTHTIPLPVPATAPLGPATVTVRATDSTERTYETSRSYTVIDNIAPSIASFTVAPSLSIHAGRTVTATVTATDDIAVKSIAFDAKLNGTSIKTESPAMSETPTTQHFTVPVANDVAGGSTLTIDVAVSDAFPGRAPTLASQTVTILPDTVAPQLTVLTPTAGSTYRESVDTIVVRVTAIDAEVAVKEAFAQLDGGTPVALARVGTTNDWLGQIPAPVVDGSSNVQRTVTVTARDYAGNAAVPQVVPVTIEAVIDPAAATLKWLCAAGPGSMFPPGYSMKLRVSAVPATVNGQPNPVQSVEMIVDDATSLTVVSLGNNQYEATFPIPPADAEGTVHRVRAIARSAGGASADLLTTFTVVVPTIAPITANTTIDTTNTTYDNKTVVIQGGTVTIRGAHTFDRLLVLGGSVVAPNLETLNVTTTRGLYVACDAAITMTGRGYSSNTTYLNHSLPTNNSGGSHIGYGAEWSGTRGATFGNVYRPAENGGSGPGGSLGGGVVHITAGAVIVDGSIAANGSTTNVSGGGGGSILIRTQSITGAGSIRANGGTSVNGYGSGGGGAIALEYTDAASVLPVLQSISGSAGTIGAPGSVYTFGPNATWGDLRIDHGGLNGQQTKLPSMGGGTAQPQTSGTTVVTDRATDIPQYFKGHWVEIRDAAGTLKGTWRIATVAGRNFELEGAGVSVAGGDRWQGVYRFDNVVLRGVRLEDTDPIRVGDTQRIESAVELRAISAQNLHIINGGSLTHMRGHELTIDLSGELRVDTGAKIDVSGRGYAGTSYPGETLPTNNSGGSHIGFGGQWGGGARGSSFGSVYRPLEKGGAGPGAVGGGTVQITASSVVVDGGILANGITEDVAGGGGGSIWIRSQSIAGAGSIEANGGNSKVGYGSGGGGAIAVEHTVGSVAPILRSKSGDAGERGAAGSSYTFGPSSTYGSVTIDNTGIGTTQVTFLPSLGRGPVVSVENGDTIVTDRASIQPYFARHWIDVFAPNGTTKGTWRIAKVDGGKLTLEGAPSIAAGDTWRGVYLFDTIKLRNAKVVLFDDLRATRDLDASSTLTINDPPVFDPAKTIVVTSAPNGDFVEGPAGTVSDPHPPIVMTARNVRTNLTYTLNAFTDGSFRVPVTGEIGDTFTLVARDSFSVPATSTSVAVSGAISSFNGVTTVGVQPSMLTGGSAVTGTVRLLYPVVRASDGVVTLASSSPSVVVPATVTVPVGWSSASFNIQTSSVAADTTATITASAGIASRSTTVTLLAGTSALTQLTLDNASVEGGTSINATLVLGAPAPAGGAMVSVSSSNTRLASVPAVVVVPEGATSFVFTVTTYPVDIDGAVVLTATYGATETADAAIDACPQLTGLVLPPSSTPLGATWLDDTLPSGATPSGDGVLDSTQFASGSSAIHLSGASAGLRTYAFTGAAPLVVNPTDKLVLYALVNPCDPPRQILVEWKSGSIGYRASWGESRIEPQTAHRIAGPVPNGGAWVRLEVLASSLAIPANTSMTGLSIRAMDGEAWVDLVGRDACVLANSVAAPELNPSEIVWFDDDVPAGAVLSQNSGVSTAWTWDATQAAGGTRSHVSPLRTGHHQHSLHSGSPLPVAPGDLLYTYVLLDPCNPPKEVMLQWTLANGTTSSNRAYWGDDLIALGTNGAATRHRVGPLPELGTWVRLEVPAAYVGLENKAITGVIFSIHDGRAWFDRVGRISRINVAAGKPATQSSTFVLETPASAVVDGNLVSINHTDRNAQAWWEVDLGASYAIEDIWIYNVDGPAVVRMNNFWVLVSNDPMPEGLTAALAQPGVSGLRYKSFPNLTAGLVVNRTGQYVRVQLEGTEYLHMREVQIWARASASRTNLAIGRKADQSIPYSDYYAAHGVDGSINYEFPHTETHSMPWWQVDLGAVQPISTISLFNRHDCCRERLSNFYVFVSDEDMTADDVATTLAQSDVRAYFYPSIPVAAEIPIHDSGRYVRIHLTGVNALHLSEVQVWSQQTALTPMSRQPVSPPER